MRRIIETVHGLNLCERIRRSGAIYFAASMICVLLAIASFVAAHP